MFKHLVSLSPIFQEFVPRERGIDYWCTLMAKGPHISLEVAEFCTSKDILLVANATTHLLQPMDVSVFKGLKYLINLINRTHQIPVPVKVKLS